MKTCLVVPVYNHQHAVARVLEKLKPHKLPCYLVDDGSSDACATSLRCIAAREKDWIKLYERAVNGGKGAAIIDGLRIAINEGYTHAIAIDADDQHQTEDIDRFLTVSEHHPDSLILGKPRFDESAPKSRYYGRRITNFWVWVNTLSFSIADGLCGFRCYPLVAVDKLLQTARLGQRMDFDFDIAVRLYWQGLDVVNIETDVRYPTDGISHFRIFIDNLLICRKHAQLFFGMLRRLPTLLMRQSP